MITTLADISDQTWTVIWIAILIGLCLLCVGLGARLIVMGCKSIRTQKAKAPSGGPRSSGKTLTGRAAVNHGWVRIVCGIGMVIFGLFMADLCVFNIVPWW